jgi:predicted nucleic acid-binding protein
VTPEFADTSYFLALLSPSDRHHRRAVELSSRKGLRQVTTEYVLLELGNALTKGSDRGLFIGFLSTLRVSPTAVIIPDGPELWHRAIDLFAARPDKNWSVTDCASFVVMTDRGLTQALTADHHFAQAGFAPLLV